MNFSYILIIIWLNKPISLIKQPRIVFLYVMIKTLDEISVFPISLRLLVSRVKSTLGIIVAIINE